MTSRTTWRNAVTLSRSRGWRSSIVFKIFSVRLGSSLGIASSDDVVDITGLKIVNSLLKTYTETIISGFEVCAYSFASGVEVVDGGAIFLSDSYSNKWGVFGLLIKLYFFI